MMNCLRVEFLALAFLVAACGGSADSYDSPSADDGVPAGGRVA